jgi:hypothetical protein
LNGTTSNWKSREVVVLFVCAGLELVSLPLTMTTLRASFVGFFVGVAIMVYFSSPKRTLRSWSEPSNTYSCISKGLRMEERMRRMALEAIDCAGTFLKRARETAESDSEPPLAVGHDISMAIKLLEAARDVVEFSYRPTLPKVSCQQGSSVE